MGKREFLIHMVMEDDMLELFEKDIANNNGKIPQTISTILEDRYKIKDTIRRGSHHLKNATSIPIVIRKSNGKLLFNSMTECDQYLKVSKGSTSKAYSKGKKVKGWTVEEAKWKRKQLK